MGGIKEKLVMLTWQVSKQAQYTRLSPSTWNNYLFTTT